MFVVVVGSMPGGPDRVEVTLALLAVGRGKTVAKARAQCHLGANNLWTLVKTLLDYAEIEPITDAKLLGVFRDHLRSRAVMEFRRRLENLRVTHGVIELRLWFGRFHQRHRCLSCREPERHHRQMCTTARDVPPGRLRRPLFTLLLFVIDALGLEPRWRSGRTHWRSGLYFT